MLILLLYLTLKHQNKHANSSSPPPWPVCRCVSCSRGKFCKCCSSCSHTKDGMETQFWEEDIWSDLSPDCWSWWRYRAPETVWLQEDRCGLLGPGPRFLTTSQCSPQFVQLPPATKHEVGPDKLLLRVILIWVQDELEQFSMVVPWIWLQHEAVQYASLGLGFLEEFYWGETGAFSEFPQSL